MVQNKGLLWSVAFAVCFEVLHDPNCKLDPSAKNLRSQKPEPKAGASKSSATSAVCSCTGEGPLGAVLEGWSESEPWEGSVCLTVILSGDLVVRELISS